jgi:hypothetical protein
MNSYRKYSKPDTVIAAGAGAGQSDDTKLLSELQRVASDSHFSLYNLNSKRSFYSDSNPKVGLTQAEQQGFEFRL